MRKFLWIALGWLAAGGCQSPKPPVETRFVQLDAARTGVDFQNTLTPTLADNILEYNYFYNGGGVAAADFDRDGRTDLYFSGNQVSSKLYLNQGDFHFEDVTEKAGVGTTGWCTGVAVADLNADGWPDLYVCHAGLRHSPNQLFINLGKQPDGSVKFSEKAREYGLDYAGFSTQAAFFDYDRDGDLDCYLLTHFHDKTNPNFPAPKRPDAHGPTADRLYRNDGPRFTDVSAAAGITAEGLGLGVAVADFNEDGWPDVYVTNDFAHDDVLYLNGRNGSFSDRTAAAFGHTSRFAMGCDAADVNNDGHPDLLTLDMMPDDPVRQKLMATALSNDVFNRSLQNGYLPQYSRNCLQLHNGDAAVSGGPTFSEIGQLAGISQTDWSWSALLADFDNDGLRDLYVTNGIPRDITNADFVAYRSEELSKSDFNYKSLIANLLERVEALPPVEKPNFGFKNRGDLTFADASQNWGLAQPGCSNGAVYADLDNDGDLDLATNNLNAPAFILQNRSERFGKTHYLRLRLDGGGIGAKIRVVAGGTAQVGEQFLQRGFQSSQEAVVHFGLGKIALVDTLDVVWPSGQGQRLTHLRADTTLTLCETDANLSDELGKPIRAKPVMEDLTARVGLAFTHREADFEDFNFEPLLPHRFSRQGPCLAVGDVNGDGLDDVFVGGPAKIAGSLFLQKKNGTFTRREMPDPGFEDTGAAFFDADADGDLDLYVVSGGNEYNPLTAAYQDRLYRNDGRGNFTRDKTALPVEFASGSCVVPGDFDRDGDVDLFVGGRVVPTQYPLPAESFLLQNNGRGVFENVTKAVCPALKTLGLVTTALWSEANGDGWPDLVVAGEWMGVLVATNHEGRLNAPAPVAQIGWWFSLVAGDFDADGDTDYVAGNLGLNSRLQASPTQPLGVYAGDFDQNGTVEAILTQFVHGREVPLPGRSDLVGAYPGLKKKVPTYTDYAKAGFHELFSAQDLDGTLTLHATEMRSVYLENQGNAPDGMPRFRVESLPIQAQIAPLQAMVATDFNHDGLLDVVGVGNWFDADFGTGRADAGGMCVMKNNGPTRPGQPQFTVLPKTAAPFPANLDVRAIVPLRIGAKKGILVGSNGGALRVVALWPRSSSFLQGPSAMRR